MDVVGKVERLRRYPVKSMQGEDVHSVFVSYSGLTGDRVYAFVDPRARPDFPWLTAREMREMLQWKPLFDSSPEPGDQYPFHERFRVNVESPDGHRMSVEDPQLLALLSTKCGRSLRLRFSEKGMQDALPVSLIGVDTVSAVAAECTGSLSPLRFRANMYVRWGCGEPCFEDSLVGQVLVIGEKLELLVSKRDSRCVVINLDPETGESDPSILRVVANRHENQLGVYCVVLQEGIVEQGAEIRLRP